jgi:carbonic anhydrase
MNLPAETALSMLREGNERFAAGRQRPHGSHGDRLSVAREQQPWAIIVGCSDSRVPVEVVFDVGPGELFVLRSAGHVIAEAGLASVRYGLEVLGAQLVVVLGHEECGAVAAVVEGYVPRWLAPITDHIGVRDGASLAEAIEDHVRESVEELVQWVRRSDMPCAPPLIVGAVYDLDSGVVSWL